MMYKLYNFEFPHEILQSIVPKNHAGLYTTYFSQTDVRCDEYYYNIINEVTTDLGLYHRCEYECYHWLQVYDKEVGHELHDHHQNSSIFSWVHFINPLDTKCFYFSDSDGNKFYPPQKKNNFIVFPSWASHEIENSPIRGRAVIAGNVFFKKLKSSIGLSTYHKIHDKLSVWEVK